MDIIDHLSASNINYRNCVYSLAMRDYDKALEWITSAIEHISLYLEANNKAQSTATGSKLMEYQKLKTTIEKGAQLPAAELNSVTAGAVGSTEKNSDRTYGNRFLTFDDVVGLEHVKNTVKSAIVYPFEYEDIYRVFKRKSGGGILLYGAPGTGKTMISKAIVGEISAEFISVNCPDVYSKWLGESQQNIKKLFDRARAAKRAVIFFDEFDAIGGIRGRENGNTSGIDGVVCELLAQIDGFLSEQNSIILVIGATNRPWDIDSALLRSGRFEKHLYIGLPDEKARKEIIRRQMNELPSEEINFNGLAESTEGFSSADVAELVGAYRIGQLCAV